MQLPFSFVFFFSNFFSTLSSSLKLFLYLALTPPSSSHVFQCLFFPPPSPWFSPSSKLPPYHLISTPPFCLPLPSVLTYLPLTSCLSSSSSPVPVHSKAEEECRQCPEEAEEPGQAERPDPAAVCAATCSTKRGGRKAGERASAAPWGGGGARRGDAKRSEGEAGGRRRGRHALDTDQTRARGDGVHGEEGGDLGGDWLIGRDVEGVAETGPSHC